MLLFAASFGVVAGLWGMIGRTDRVPVIWVALIALLVSGLLSYVLLRRPREALAHRIQGGVSAANDRIERSRTREDVD